MGTVVIHSVPFQLNNATGNQTITDPSGPGLTPKFAIFVVSSATSVDTVIDQARMSVGVTDGTNHRVTGFMAESGSLSVNADTGRRVDPDTVINMCTTANQALDYEAAFVSFGTNAVTISNSVARQFRGYVVLGYGSDLQAAVTDHLSSATKDVASSITGLAFAPDCGFFFSAFSAFSADTGLNNVLQSFGFAGRVPSTTQASMTIAATDVATTATATGQIVRNDAIITRITSAIALDSWVELTTWESGGVTVTTRNQNVAIRFAALLLNVGGRKCWAGAPSLTTNSTGDHTLTDIGHQPHFLMVLGGSSPTVNALDATLDATLSIGVGVASGAEAVAGWNDRDALTTSDSQSVFSEGNLVEVVSTISTFVWVASLASMTSNGFTYNVSDTVSTNPVTPVFSISDDTAVGCKVRALGRVHGTIVRLRVSSSAARGIASARGIAARVRPVVGSGRGVARVAVVVTRLRLPTGRASGVGRAIASPTRARSCVGRGAGIARAVTSPTRARAATGRSFGGGRVVGVATVTGTGVQTAKGLGRGAARGSAVVVRLRSVVGVSRGLARSQAVLARVRATIGVSRGIARALGSTSRARLATGTARGSAREVGAITRLRLAQASARGAASSYAVAVRVKPRVGQARGAARVAGVVARLRIAAGGGRGAARVAASALRSRVATGRSSAGARSLGATGRARVASGAARGGSRASGRFGIKTVLAIARGSSLARAWASKTTSVCAAIDTGLDERILPKALDVVTRLGRTVTFVTVVSQSYSTATGRVTRIGSTPISVVASPPLQYKDSWVDGETIRKGDAQLIVPKEGLGFVPERKMDVIIDDGRWTIENVQLVRSGNQVAIYVLQLRGAKAPRASSTSDQGSLDARLPTTARRLIQKYGKKVTFHVASARLRDVQDGTVTDVGDCEFCELVVFDPTDRRIDAGWTSESENGDGYLRAEGLGFEPYKGMRVEFDTQRWVVASLEPIYTGGRIGAWRLGFGM